MALTGDIVSRRAEGSPTHVVTVAPRIRIGVVTLSRGKKTSGTAEFNSHVAGGSDSLNSITNLIRAITKVVDESGDEYYPNVHFQVKSGTTIVDPNNTGDYDDPSSLALDWSIAPAIFPPAISKYSISSVGGEITAGTYYYRLVIEDNNGNLTTGGPVTIVTIDSGTTNTITLYWNPVKYASAIRLYKSTDGSTWTAYESLAASAISFTDTGDTGQFTDSEAIPSTNSSKQEPPASGSPAYTLYYYYADFSDLSVKSYTSYKDVVDDHGIGSLADNIARIVLVEKGAPELIISPVPEKKYSDGSWVDPDNDDYLDAIAALDTMDITFLAITKVDSTLFTNALQKVETLSDKVNGQMERYLLWSLTDDFTSSDINTYLTQAQASASQGKRVFFVIPHSNDVKVYMWRNSDGSYSSNVNVTAPDSSQSITPVIEAIAALAVYASTGDPAEPLTEKSISGFYHYGTAFDTETIKTYTDQGVTILVADEPGGIPYVYRAILTCMPNLSIEDSELSIAVTEDLMDKENREFLKRFRGKKALDKRLRSIKSLFINQVLNEYLRREWIADFDKSSVSITQNATDPTRIDGYYKYRPVYPINKIWVDHEFIV